jgi:type IX secretion system PorP/SprF family membrane protein
MQLGNYFFIVSIKISFYNCLSFNQLYKLKKAYLVFFISFIKIYTIDAQLDPQFSQYMASSIYMNPAMSGLEHRIAVSGIARTQMIGLNPVQMGMFNIIAPLFDRGEKVYHPGGIGANVWTSRFEKAGVNSLGASLNMAYNLHIAATTAQNLSFGLQAGFVQRQYTGLQTLEWGSSYNNGVVTPTTDANFVGVSGTKLYPDITAGLLYYYNAGRDIYAPGMSAYIGLVGAHLNQPNESLLSGKTEKVPMLYRAHGGIEFHLAKRLNATPNFIAHLQGSTLFYMAGINFSYLFPDQDEYFKPTKFVMGTFFRNGESIVAQLGVGSKYYALGLSYDLGALGYSQSAGRLASAVELSFKTTFQFNSSSKKSSKFQTPLM